MASNDVGNLGDVVRDKKLKERERKARRRQEKEEAAAKDKAMETIAEEPSAYSAAAAAATPATPATPAPKPKTPAPKPEPKPDLPAAVSVPDAVVGGEGKGKGKGTGKGKAPGKPGKPVEREPTWPRTKCNTCGEPDDWRDMRSVKEWHEEDEEQEGAGEDGKVWWFVWVRTCISCVAAERKCTPQEAMAHIAEESPGYQSQARRASKFAKVMNDQRQIFESITDKGQLRQLTLDALTSVFAPMAQALALKCAHMEELGEQSAARRRILEQIKKTKSASEARSLLIELRSVHEQEELIAWKERCTDKATGKVDTQLQRKFLKASSYADEWCSSDFGHMKMFWICLKKTDWNERLQTHVPCRRMQVSKGWKTKKADPLAAGQSWQCSCGGTYKAGFGVLLEVKLATEGFVRYLRAEAPQEYVWDALSKFHELELVDVASPADLYNKLPIRAPLVTEAVEVIDEAQGIYRVTSQEFLDTVPTWEWCEIFRLTGRVVVKPLTKKQQKEKDWADWEEAQKSKKRQ